MRIKTLDGKQLIEVNYMDSQLKMACAAEWKGDIKQSEIHFCLAVAAEGLFFDSV
jgi:hypothetical protein